MEICSNIDQIAAVGHEHGLLRAATGSLLMDEKEVAPIIGVDRPAFPFPEYDSHESLFVTLLVLTSSTWLKEPPLFL